MRTFILSIMMATSAQVSFAQPIFQNVYTGGLSARCRMVELDGGQIVVSMAQLESSNPSGTSVMSSAGEILSSNLYHLDTLLALQAFRMIAPNQFCLVGGYYKDPCPTGGIVTDPAIWWMDTLGQVSGLKRFKLNGGGCRMILRDLSVAQDGSVLTWGRDFGFYAMRLLPTGELDWARSYNGIGGVQFVKEFPNGDLLMGMNIQGAGAVIARTDAAGNFIWLKSYIRPKGMVHDAVIESDHAVLVVGATDSIASTNSLIPYPSSYQPNLFMLRLDGDGEVQWCRGYASNPRWYTRRGSRIEKAADGNYVVLANIGNFNYNIQLWPFLMKTDPTGDTIWTRSFGVSGFRYGTQELLLHSDGSIMFNGLVSGNLINGDNGASYIFKADSLGHLPCSERYQPIVITELFPSDSSITLTFESGAVELPAYMEQLGFTPIEAADACILINGIGSPAGARQQRPTIRPNPNAGQFTVQFSDPLMAESYYSVFDAMGKLLFQRPLPPGRETEQVDLSRFGAGTYVIRFTDQEGSCYEPVVVE